MIINLASRSCGHCLFGVLNIKLNEVFVKVDAV
jgi:hypothetical protein